MYTVLFPVNELKIGGAEQQLLELVRGMDKSRFLPIVAPLYPDGPLTPEFRSIPGVEVIDLHRRGKYDPSPLWRIARILRRYHVDIVQPFLSPATFFGLIPALVMNTPVKIVTERCGVRQSRGIGYKLYRTTEDWFSRFADAIIPNSMAGENMLLERGLPAGKIRVIYNGINHERLQVDPSSVAKHRAELGVTSGGKVVGILASLTPAKGHDVLLRAVASMGDQHDTRIAVIGDGRLRPDLETLAGQLGISDRVTFFGYQRAVSNYLAACDLLVSASRDNEGCSNSILEAMALGIPVIATDIGGNRELVRDGETGLLTPVGDERALASAIARLVTDDDLAKRCAAQARQMIQQQFSLSRMVQDYEQIYLTAMAKERHAVRSPTSS
jgi:glycosyltransferase involved in cell wall biosynthesis